MSNNMDFIRKISKMSGADFRQLDDETLVRLTVRIKAALPELDEAMKFKLITDNLTDLEVTKPLDKERMRIADAINKAMDDGDRAAEKRMQEARDNNDSALYAINNGRRQIFERHKDFLAAIVAFKKTINASDGIEHLVSPRFRASRDKQATLTFLQELHVVSDDLE